MKIFAIILVALALTVFQVEASALKMEAAGSF
jgi:hypothetical protein